MVMLAGVVGVWMAEDRAVGREAAGVQGRGLERGMGEAAGRETMIAGYFGAPYTYASTIKIRNPAEKTDLTVAKVGWDGKPRPAASRPKIDNAKWPEAVEGMSDTFLGEPFLGPLG